MSPFSVFLVAATLGAAAASSFLSVQGGNLPLGGEPVFLSGANLPWIQYGADFGNAQSNALACGHREAIANVSAHGGNSIRVWLFTEGDAIPQWDDASGAVVATDANGTLIADLASYLEYAAAHDVLVTLTLWNGALMRNARVVNMVRDVALTQTFLDAALTPLVAALSARPALGAWEVGPPARHVALARPGHRREP